jgi:hypothetical protein
MSALGRKQTFAPSAAMSPPIPLPPRRTARPHCRARQVAKHGRMTPGGCAAAARRACGTAAHRGGSYPDMAGGQGPSRSPEELHKAIACDKAVQSWTWVAAAASSVELPSADARNSDLRPFGAPDRPVTIPDRNWRAGECCAGSQHLCSSCDDHRHHADDHSDGMASGEAIQHGKCPRRVESGR